MQVVGGIKMRVTEKQKMINELMEGTNYPHSQDIRNRLNRRTTDVIRFYFNVYYKGRNMKKEYVIQDIIRLG